MGTGNQNKGFMQQVLPCHLPVRESFIHRQNTTPAYHMYTHSNNKPKEQRHFETQHSTEVLDKEAAQREWDALDTPISQLHHKARGFFAEIGAASSIMHDFRHDPKHLELLEVSRKEQEAGTYVNYPSYNATDLLTAAETQHARQEYNHAVRTGQQLSRGDIIAAATPASVRKAVGRIAVGFWYDSTVSYCDALHDEAHPDHSKESMFRRAADPSSGF